MNDVSTRVEVDFDPDDGIIEVSRRGTCLPLTLTEAHQVAGRLIDILLRQVQPPAGSPTVVDLALVEQVLYRERGVLDPQDVPALLATITAACTTSTPPAAGVTEPAEPEPAPPGRWP